MDSREEKEVLMEINKEYADLATKINALSYFITTDLFKTLSQIQKNLLVMQLSGMDTYAKALLMRLEDLKENLNK